MVRTKGAAATLQNWKSAQGRVPQAYKDGIARANNWQSKAMEGADNYAAGVNEAISEGRREKGISRVSDGEWKNAASTKGAARIASGMAAAEGKFNTGMSRNLATIEGVSIPARTQNGMENIDNRLKPIAQALMDQKRSG